MRKIRWGILGTGRIAQQFAQDMPHVPNGELVAVGARSKESSDAFTARHSISRSHASYASLLNDPDVDAVYIASPHTLHHEHAAASMRAGKAVLCEKPLTTTVAECESLMREAASSGVYLMEAMWTWFLPAMLKAQEWVAEGRIGSIRHIKADFGYPLLPYDASRREYDATLGGGCLLEMGIYPIALALLFLRRDPDSMRVVTRYAPNGVEDDVAMLFEYADCTATLATSFRAKLQNWAYIIGDEGYIAIPDFWRASECHLYHLDTRINHFQDSRRTLGFAYEAIAVGADVIAGRRESEVMPLATSLRLQQHMERVRESARKT